MEPKKTVNSGARESEENKFNSKVQRPEYRHVSKKTTSGAKKYYYSVQTTKDDMVEVTMKSGSKYYGQINEKNERHGYGQYHVVNGGRYEGMWRNGFKHGEGKFYHRNGALLYDGEWQAGEPHGNGTAYGLSGKVAFQGSFKNGKSSEKKNWQMYKNM